MKKLFIFLLLGSLSMSSCVDLDIPAKNVVDDKALLSNSAGMDIYLARLYSLMPFEDFKYMGRWGWNYSSWLGAMGIEGTGEAVNRDDITRAFVGEDESYWSKSYALLREANYLIETLPNFRESHTDIIYNQYLGEAYFARAMAFTAMAKRFGGVPLVTKVIGYPQDLADMEVPRSSEQETWDQVLADFDMAASLLSPKSLKSGQSNKFVALAYKSDAMLYAGSVAKYNETVAGRLTGLGQKSGKRVIGFDAGTSAATSKKYFTEAYKAARRVMKEGDYELYMKKWAAGDKQAQYQNMVDMFSDLTSKENILVKQYIYPIMTHGYDAYSAPFVFRAPLSAGTCPTLDYVELFDGFDRYPDGTIRVTDGNSNSEGNYLLFDKTMDFFKNAEPRLRAYVIFPGDMFKGKEIEIRGGIYTGETPIKPLFNDYSYSTAGETYEKLPAATKTPKTLYLSTTNTANDPVVIDETGKTMPAAGENGPFYSNGEATLTGFFGRKWLNPDPAFVAGEGKSAQPFILMRYAEVMLNAAEAGVELALAGEATIDGEDVLDVATNAVDKIRERAGAIKLATKITNNTDGRDIVRKERRKELSLEHKTKWDLRRWRVLHYEGRDGLWGEQRDRHAYSNNARYHFRGLYPFYSSKAKKYFFDARFQWVAVRTFEYNIVDYYFGVPGGEVSKSPVIDQQPNR